MDYLPTERLETRTCGECTACCVVPVIDVPELKKAADVRCRNLSATGGCSIYARRPGACRTFMCVWRLVPFPEAYRPDRCGLLLYPRPDAPLSIAAQPIGDQVASLYTALAMQLFDAWVRNDVPIVAWVPTKPGHLLAQVGLNVPLKDACVAGDLAEARAILEQLVERARASETSPRKPLP